MFLRALGSDLLFVKNGVWEIIETQNKLAQDIVLDYVIPETDREVTMLPPTIAGLFSPFL
jgi:hypothetical protein